MRGNSGSHSKKLLVGLFTFDLYWFFHLELGCSQKAFTLLFFVTVAEALQDELFSKLEEGEPANELQ